MGHFTSLAIKLKKPEISKLNVIIIYGGKNGKTLGSEVLTFSQRYEGDVVGENALGNRWTGSNAGVVAAVRGVHLGDIEVSCYLGDKTPTVQWDESGEFIEDPAE